MPETSPDGASFELPVARGDGRFTVLMVSGDETIIGVPAGESLYPGDYLVPVDSETGLPVPGSAIFAVRSVRNGKAWLDGSRSDTVASRGDFLVRLPGLPVDLDILAGGLMGLYIDDGYVYWPPVAWMAWTGTRVCFRQGFQDILPVLQVHGLVDTGSSVISIGLDAGIVWPRYFGALSLTPGVMLGIWPVPLTDGDLSWGMHAGVFLKGSVRLDRGLELFLEPGIQSGLSGETITWQGISLAAGVTIR